MQDAGHDRVYVSRYLAERRRLERGATLITETPPWRLYAEPTASPQPEWRTFVAIRSTPPIHGSDIVSFRLGHNGRRWENRRNLFHLMTIHREMLAEWELHLRESFGADPQAITQR